jgi:hypothetical protein
MQVEIFLIKKFAPKLIILGDAKIAKSIKTAFRKLKDFCEKRF